MLSLWSLWVRASNGGSMGQLFLSLYLNILSRVKYLRLFCKSSTCISIFNPVISAIRVYICLVILSPRFCNHSSFNLSSLLMLFIIQEQYSKRGKMVCMYTFLAVYSFIKGLSLLNLNSLYAVLRRTVLVCSSSVNLLSRSTPKYVQWSVIGSVVLPYLIIVCGGRVLI